MLIAVLLILLNYVTILLASGLRRHRRHDQAGAELSDDPSASSRRLLFDVLNCSPAAIDDFPLDVFSQSERLHGAIALHVLGAAYMFVGLALVCDEYFVPSLEAICRKLKVEDNVAGATFMAAGSSAPEMATALIGVFIAKNDIGLGTIVGSAVFNVLFVPAACALGAGMVIYLLWWPLVRDLICYAIAIITLALIILDGSVFWYEALVVVLLYVLYIILMKFDSTVQCWAMKCCRCVKIAAKITGQEQGQQQTAATASNGEGGGSPINLFMDEELRSTQRPERIHQSRSNNEAHTATPKSNGTVANQEVYVNCINFKETRSTVPAAELRGEMGTDLDQSQEIVEAEAEGEASASAVQDRSTTDVFTCPSGKFSRFVYVIGFPLTTLLFLTIPDCRSRRFRRLFWLTFVTSTVWIGVFAYVMVWMIVVIGSTFSIADSLMGVTFVAFGASLPDLISSYLVVKAGKGDMAISNAIGSNVFDILVCLGVPWLLRTLIKDDARVQGISVYSNGLLYSTFTLLGTVFLFLLVNVFNKWKMDKKYGAILLILYIVFMVIASLYEVNIFGYVNPPVCPTS